MNKIINVNQESMQNRMYTFRDIHIMVDRDLAEIYNGV